MLSAAVDSEEWDHVIEENEMYSKQNLRLWSIREKPIDFVGRLERAAELSRKSVPIPVARLTATVFPSE